MQDFEKLYDASFIQKLIDYSCPQFTGEGIIPLPSAGTDNILYRLGSKLLIRLPAYDLITIQIQKEAHWLPQVSKKLSVKVPTCVLLVEPSELFPFYWSVWEWIDADTAELKDCLNNASLYDDLFVLLKTLRSEEDKSIPLYGQHNAFRGQPLKERDLKVRAALHKIAHTIDGHRALKIWSDALVSECGISDLRLIHGDLHPHNLLIKEGALAAVIDWGLMGRGDPACDLMAAWTLLDHQHRINLKRDLVVSEPEWLRARGWALSFSVIILDFYGGKNKYLYDLGLHVMRELLSD